MKVHLAVFTPIFWWQASIQEAIRKMGLPFDHPRRRHWGWGNRWFPIPPIAQSWPANTNKFQLPIAMVVVLLAPGEMPRWDDIMIVELSIFHHGITPRRSYSEQEIVARLTLSCAVLKVVAIVTIVVLMPSQFVFTDAAIYDVGWSPDTDLQAWADSKTFYPNDSLVFKYTEYNVLEVTQLAFMNCLTTNPVSEYNSGPTMIKLSEPGTRFFISGGPESCLIKLSIDVFSLPD